MQYRFTPARLATLAGELLDDPAASAAMREAFTTIRERLGGPGAGARAAEAVLSIL